VAVGSRRQCLEPTDRALPRSVPGGDRAVGCRGIGSFRSPRLLITGCVRHELIDVVDRLALGPVAVHSTLSRSLRRSTPASHKLEAIGDRFIGPSTDRQ